MQFLNSEPLVFFFLYIFFLCNTVQLSTIFAIQVSIYPTEEILILTLKKIWYSPYNSLQLSLPLIFYLLKYKTLKNKMI